VGYVNENMVYEMRKIIRKVCGWKGAKTMFFSYAFLIPGMSLGKAV
jgi:hypothetical protein